MRAWIIHGDLPTPVTDLGPIVPPPGGFLWLDFNREDAADLAATVERMSGLVINPEHVEDCLIEHGVSFYDGTNSYDMVILREPIENKGDWLPETRPLAVILNEQLIVTVHSPGGVVIDRVRTRIERPGAKQPQRPTGLLWRLLADAIDGYLSIRGSVNQQLELWQDALLDPANPFDDWMELVRRRRELRMFQTMVNRGEEALGNWREDPMVKFDETLQVRVSDLVEHLRRVNMILHHAEEEINSFIQLHFAATTHRSNEIMKVLTVVSAIFLPLNLVAGVFGMNFVNIPASSSSYGFYVTIALIVAFGSFMLWYFRRQHWF
jgi:magnesium/cobalt transport protein CorA